MLLEVESQAPAIQVITTTLHLHTLLLYTTSLHSAFNPFPCQSKDTFILLHLIPLYIKLLYLFPLNMLSNWWYPPPEEGNRSSTDEGRVDTDDDTQVMEPDQGNGKSTKLPAFDNGSQLKTCQFLYADQP